MSVLYVGDALVHYEVLGRGRPVVFLHTWGGSWRYWLSPMQAISSSYRSYALDFYGFGDTSHASTLYALETQAALVESFLEEMGMERAALIGHGLGAMVSLLMARSQPDRVARLMAVGLPMVPPTLQDRLRRQTLSELVEWMTGRRRETIEFLAESGKADPAALVTSFADADVPSVLHAVRGTGVPLLLLYGANDPLAPRDAFAPPEDIRTIELENAGHFAVLDAAPRFRRLLLDFLAADSENEVQDLQLKTEWKRRVR